MEWGIGVVTVPGGDRWATVAVQVENPDQYETLSIRFRRAGMRALSAGDWDAGRLPLTTCSVTVENEAVTQLHTGASRLICTQPLDLTPSWAGAAARGRVLLTLVKPGGLPAVGVDRLLPGEHLEALGDMMGQAAQRRELVAGLARVLDAPAPIAGPSTKRPPGFR